jgi:uncharacterized membrane protein
MPETIGNPLSWAFGTLRSAFSYGSSVVTDVGTATDKKAALPIVRTITVDDLRIALRKGWDDLSAFRTDVVFVCLLYPIMGIVLVALAVQGDFVYLMFPAVSGFALAGPVAAVGLYEMSRRREKGMDANWLAYIDVLRSPKFGAVVVLGLFHMVIFAVWIMVANLIYDVTLGPENPLSIMAFLNDVVTTPAGWAMAIIGIVVGFLFAVAVLAMSVVSFPLLLDRDVGVPLAVVTSVKVALQNPVPIGVWGLIVAVSLAVGSLPALLGLVLVMPVLGHATWHLYRRAVV